MEINSGLKQHDKSVLHKLSMTKWEGYKITEPDKSILSLINKENETLIKENRYSIAIVAEILLFQPVKTLLNVNIMQTVKA